MFSIRDFYFKNVLSALQPTDDKKLARFVYALALFITDFTLEKKKREKKLKKQKLLPLFQRIKFKYGQFSSNKVFHIKLRKCSKRVFYREQSLENFLTL